MLTYNEDMNWHITEAFISLKIILHVMILLPVKSSLVRLNATSIISDNMIHYYDLRPFQTS